MLAWGFLCAAIVVKWLDGNIVVFVLNLSSEAFSSTRKKKKSPWVFVLWDKCNENNLLHFA